MAAWTRVCQRRGQTHAVRCEKYRAGKLPASGEALATGQGPGRDLSRSWASLLRPTHYRDAASQVFLSFTIVSSFKISFVA